MVHPTFFCPSRPLRAVNQTFGQIFGHSGALAFLREDNELEGLPASLEELKQLRMLWLEAVGYGEHNVYYYYANLIGIA